MTIRLFVLSICFITVLVNLKTAQANTAKPSIKLVVKLNKLETKRKGTLKVFIYANEENWLDLDKALAVKFIPITSDSTRAEVVFKLPVITSIAVQAFHDENDNGKLDFNWFPPKPAEGVGVSNNTVSFGPPNFTDAMVPLTAPVTETTIEMSY